MTMTRTRDRLRQLLTVALVVLMAAALLPLRAVSAAAQDERGHGSPSVQITAPTTADPITVAPGGALEVTFEANRRWRYELSVRASGGGWVSPGGAASGPVDRHSANVAEITVPEDMPLGVADLRVRLLTPAGVERAVDVAAAAIEITVEPEPPTTVFTTDFKEDEHRVGEPPVGWSEFRLPGSWAIRNAPRRLEAAIAPGGRQGLMWDVPGDGGIVEGDVEVAGLVRGQTTGNALFQLALHASGDGTDYYYVDAWPANGNIRINRFVGDSFSTLRSAPAGVPVSNGIWYQVVVRREGDVLSAKLWPFGEPEPAGWQVSVTDATHHRGQVGVTHLNEGTVNDWAWFSVALAGEHAERAPDDVFDPDPDAEVTAVEVTPDTVAVEIGDTLALAATAHYDDGAAVDVTTTATWTSADTEVATVSATGVVTGVAEGTTEITAAVDGVAGTATVTVVEQLPPTTGFEDRGGDGWTTHSEELAFLEEVDDRSDRVAISVVGETVQGRPLHLVRVGYPEAPDDAEIAAGHSVLVVGSQHGNEPAGREAALQHLRDLAFSEDPEVLARLETITMLYIPTANPDGRVANTRGNADGIDTNRDHHRLATAEATAVAEAVTRFDPEIVIDLHERPSDSAPDVELLWPRNLNVDESLRQLTVELVQEHLRPALEDAGFSTGLYGSPTGAGDGDERIARNVFGLRHKLGLLSETAGQDPPLARVDAHHLTVEQTLAFFAARRDDVEAETTGAAARRQAHGAARGVFYLDGRDDVSPPPADGIVDPGPCGYVLSPAEVARIERHIELFGIATETTDDGRALLRMDQPMMTIIPFLVDPRAFSPLANGLVADDCDDLPDPPQPAVVSTSFTEPEHVVGDKPVGWRRFRTDGGWAVRNLPRRLEATIGPGGRQGLMWSEPGNLGLVEGDVEVAGLVRGQTTGNALFQLALHASGDGTDYYYVDAWPANGNIRINRFVGDSFSTLRSAPAGVPVSNGIWYQVVVRREGDVLSAKLWPFGEPEPAGWQVSVTDATHHRGQVGVTHLNEGTVNDWAWFSVATGGQQAQRAPADVFEPGPDADLETVVVSPSEAITGIGGTVELTASAVWDDGNGRDVTTTATWTSADTEVATVSATGVVTGVAEGTTEISATYEDVSGSATVVVDEDYVDTPEGSHSYGVGQVETSEGGMVAAADGLAAEAGADMLEAGGNAVDAAVATAFTLAVVEPTMSGLGGRAQILIRTPDGEYEAIDGGTEVPANYDPAQAPPTHESGRGYGTIALPGVVAALTRAHEEHGSLPLEQVMAPAIELASEGFPLPARQADFLAELAVVSDPQHEAAQRYFLRPDGTPYTAGDTLVQTDLAGVLEAIAEEGAEVFYEGWIADAIVEDMEDFGGFLTAEQLAGYEARDGIVVDGSYHGHELHSVYDPARGQVTIQALQMMEHFDLAACAPGAGWASIVHQAYRIGMADRQLPPDEVTSKEHAAQRAQDITDHCETGAADAAATTTTSLDPAGATTTTGADLAGAASTGLDPDGVAATFDVPADDPDREGHTTHVSTADPDGMAVALTQTLGPANGSMVATEGLGFLYASTMGYAGSTPGTRPSTNLTPLVVERDGELEYVLGAAGGAQIVTAVLMTLARTFDEGLSLAEAVAAPRLHPTGDTTVRVEDDPAAGAHWPAATLAGLVDLGYSVPTYPSEMMGRVHAVAYDPDTGVFTGVADPRREGRAVGP